MAAAVNGKSGRTAKGGAIKESKGNNGPVGSSKNASAKAAAASVNVLDEPLVEYATTSKPDRELYNKEQEAIKAQLAVKQAQLVSTYVIVQHNIRSCTSWPPLLCTLLICIELLIRTGQDQGPHCRLIRSRSSWREEETAKS